MISLKFCVEELVVFNDQQLYVNWLLVQLTLEEVYLLKISSLKEVKFKSLVLTVWKFENFMEFIFQKLINQQKTSLHIIFRGLNDALISHAWF